MTPRLIWLSTYNGNQRGKLTVADNLPFDIRRVFYIYDVPLGVTRGGHAHKKCSQFLIATDGMVTVKTRTLDGKRTEFLLDDMTFGLYVPPGVFLDMLFLTPDSCLLVLASEPFDPNDYVEGS